MISKTYFKPTNWNGYFPVQSCHHKKWVNNILKGQFTRLRHNCTDILECDAQATFLKDRFLEKRYSGSQLNKDIETV